MDLYISMLLLGAAGLAVMALSGLGIGGHWGHGHHAVGAHGAHGVHAGHAGAHHGLHGRAGGSQSSAIQSARGPQVLRAGVRGAFGLSKALSLVTSPRFLFSFALGFGAAGSVVRPIASGPLQLAVAILGGVALERLLVAPLWNVAMRFASAPAATLESAVLDEATAVTAFDANGQGIVSLEVDGQIVQVLATLQSADRQLGVRVRAGQRVRIQDVNPASNQCTVSLI